jgi:predicted O-methyltransferase YrrM
MLRRLKNKIKKLTPGKSSVKNGFEHVYGEPSPSAKMIINQSPNQRVEMIKTLDRLEYDPYCDSVLKFHKEGILRFGEQWDFLDLPLVVFTICKILQPKDYLEVGVRRGRTLACAAKAAPAIRLKGLDLWMENYAGIPNPGPAFVSQQIKLIHPRVKLELLSGDSHVLLPSIPEKSFDLITIDGDHSEVGAMQDLKEAYRLARPGGAILFDDISHPAHPYLEKVWKDFVTEHNLDHAEYSAAGYGVGVAFKKHLEAFPQ